MCANNSLPVRQAGKIPMSKFKANVLSFVICALVLLSHFSFFVCHLAYTQDPKEEESLFVAKKAFEDGFYEVSLGLFEKFLKNYPNSSKAPEVNLLIGQCYFHQNRFLDALAKFEELASTPSAGNVKDAAIYWIGEVHFRGNVFNKAAQYYKMVVDEFPKSSYAAASYYSLGWCLFQESKFNEALRYFKIVEEKFPKEPQAQDASFKIIECLYNLKDYTGLKENVKSYGQIYAKDSIRLPYIYFYSAEADYYSNSFTEAIDGYNKVIANTGDDRLQALSKLGIGWANLKLKKYKEAESAFLEVRRDNLEKRSLDVLLLGKAILCFETARISEAKDIYSELLNETSDQLVLIQSYIGKADAFYNLGEYNQAINIYKEAFGKITDESGLSEEIVDKLHYGLAWAYLKEGEFKEAIDEFQKLVRHTEDKIVKVSALCQIGDTYQDSGDYSNAVETYDSILKDYPDSLYGDYVQYQLGLTLIKLNNYDGAILAFQSLKKNFPASKLLDDASYALGLAYFQREDYAASKDVFERFKEEFKDSSLRSQAVYLLGTSLYNLGKFAEAIEVFKDIVRTYSQETELVQKAEYEIADCFYQMGNEKEAMIRFKLLRSKYPDSKLTAEVIWWLGEYYYRRNELDLARRYFSSLIQDFPKTNLIASAYYALGSIYQEESKYQEAIDNFKKVIELDSSDLAATACVAIADIYAKQEKLDLAIETYRKVAREHPNLSLLIYPKMADICRKMNDNEQALDLYTKSLEVAPVREMSNIQFKIAETKQAQGKLQEAIGEYLKVTYLYSEDKDLAVKSLLRVAAIYEDEMNFKEAVNIYKRIISLGVEEAKYAQERIDWIKAHVK
jgi:TolA-binding protein